MRNGLGLSGCIRMVLAGSHPRNSQSGLCLMNSRFKILGNREDNKKLTVIELW
jgi:hypothetical protein